MVLPASQSSESTELKADCDRTKQIAEVAVKENIARARRVVVRKSVKAVQSRLQDGRAAAVADDGRACVLCCR